MRQQNVNELGRILFATTIFNEEKENCSPLEIIAMYFLCPLKVLVLRKDIPFETKARL